MIIHLICAARPNFMKIAPLFHALKNEKWADTKIIHTGQHYDINMSDSFFTDLQLPDPDVHLGAGSGTHSEQTAKVMVAYEKILLNDRPDVTIVVGDVNSTMACTLAAVKIRYPEATEFNITRPLIAHLEAGLRSFDRTMPEEINRIVTDSLADILWTPSPDGDENLIREGINKDKIRFVGNIMIDSLEMRLDKIRKLEIYNDYQLSPQEYGLVTLHRPSNVDGYENLRDLFTALVDISANTPLIFPVHPRTRKNLDKYNLKSIIHERSRLILAEPISYTPFMNLLLNSKFVITDSGGIQEETTYLGLPCITVRENTERPITIHEGTNRLCEVGDIKLEVKLILREKRNNNKPLKYWDGRTADRIVLHLKSLSNYVSTAISRK